MSDSSCLVCLIWWIVLYVFLPKLCVGEAVFPGIPWKLIKKHPTDRRGLFWLYSTRKGTFVLTWMGGNLKEAFISFSCSFADFWRRASSVWRIYFSKREMHESFVFFCVSLIRLTFFCPLSLISPGKIFRPIALWEQQLANQNVWKWSKKFKVVKGPGLFGTQWECYFFIPTWSFWVCKLLTPPTPLCFYLSWILSISLYFLDGFPSHFFAVYFWCCLAVC